MSSVALRALLYAVHNQKKKNIKANIKENTYTYCTHTHTRLVRGKMLSNVADTFAIHKIIYCTIKMDVLRVYHQMHAHTHIQLDGNMIVADSHNMNVSSSVRYVKTIYAPL